MAGATAVQIGTANFYEPKITIRLIRELAEFCEARGLDNVRGLIGAVKV
jgi:dihydroorotate dehydrogenase (NAD+) catalytic subunit